MSTKALVTVTTFGCGFVMMGALFGLAALYNDINNFYDSALGDIQEFKVYANDAWEDMIRSSSAAAGESARAMLFGRNKRSGGECQCSAASGGCPAGPPGPKGQPGLPGEDGLAGDQGQDGNKGVSIPQKGAYDSGCIVCPAGPPGPPGPEGPQGEVGRDGRVGEDGAPGNDGEPGLSGEPGDAGENGQPGQDGRPGAPGKNGVRGRGQPGRPGARGAVGPAGQPGADGDAGLDGSDGAEGPVGQPGQDGEAGSDGQNGLPGGDGVPGADAAYCPCPPRTAELPVSQVGASSYGDAAPAAQPQQGGYRRKAARVVRV